MVIAEIVGLPIPSAYTVGQLADVACFLYSTTRNATDVAAASGVVKKLVIAQFEVKQVIGFGIEGTGSAARVGQSGGARSSRKS